ncbi:MAG: Crp/Fnr family transcriptional regulator [Candidatus Velthaea sp.]|jgi:CRP-like cAMP-binding protein
MHSSDEQFLSQNAIFASLNEHERGVLRADGHLAEFKLRQSVYQPEATIDAAYFPIDCVFSVVTHMEDGSMVEVGTIGREGTTAIPLIMGANTTANESFCQVHGRAWKLPAQSFIALLEGSPDFRAAMNRYLQAYVNMLGQMAACNGLHSVLERCARWLLMTQDRVGGSDFPMTHEFLAAMLGSRRSGVTVAAATLQGAGYIRYAHGQVTITDRAGLEATACECYQVAQQQFNSLLQLRATSAPP